MIPDLSKFINPAAKKSRFQLPDQNQAKACQSMSVSPGLYWYRPKGGETKTATKKASPPALRETTQRAALKAVERLLELLENPDASHADVLKASALIFERIYPAQGQGAAGGDYEICVKEE